MGHILLNQARFVRCSQRTLWCPIYIYILQASKIGICKGHTIADLGHMGAQKWVMYITKPLIHKQYVAKVVWMVLETNSLVVFFVKRYMDMNNLKKLMFYFIILISACCIIQTAVPTRFILFVFIKCHLWVYYKTKALIHQEKNS